jgi:hypothetical protein
VLHVVAISPRIANPGLTGRSLLKQTEEVMMTGFQSLSVDFILLAPTFSRGAGECRERHLLKNSLRLIPIVTPQLPLELDRQRPTCS